MNGFGTFVDTHGILGATADASREQALKVRDALRQMLMAIEDMHQLPRSIQTKSERDAELTRLLRAYEQVHGLPRQTGNFQFRDNDHDLT